MIRHLRATAALAVVLLAVGLAAPSADAGPDDEARFVAMVNQARSAAGVAPLSVHGELIAAGRSWAGSMAAAGGISHDPSLGSTLSAPWLLVGENVGRGPSVEVVFQALMASPSHHRNIVDPRFTHIGVGVVQTADGVLYTAHRFMQLAPPPPPPPVATPAAAAEPAPPPPPPAETTTTAAPAPPSTTVPPTTTPETTTTTPETTTSTTAPAADDPPDPTPPAATERRAPTTVPRIAGAGHDDLPARQPDDLAVAVMGAPVALATALLATTIRRRRRDRSRPTT